MQHDDDNNNNDEDARPRLSLRTSSVSKRSPLLMLLGRYDWTYFLDPIADMAAVR